MYFLVTQFFVDSRCPSRTFGGPFFLCFIMCEKRGIGGKYFSFLNVSLTYRAWRKDRGFTVWPGSFSLPPSCHPNPPICYFLLLPPSSSIHLVCSPLPSPFHADTLNWSATTTRCCDWLPPRRWVSQAAQQHGSWSCRPLMHHSTPLMLLLLI